MTTPGASDTVKLILQISPDSAVSADSAGALPIHWAMRNGNASQELIEILLSANGESIKVADNNGYLPLHWAVNTDQPNVETVRRLLALHPAAAAVHTRSEGPGLADSQRGGGLLPLHICVDRDVPSQAVLRALLDVHPEGVRTASTGSQHLLPLHVCVAREQPHLETVALLVAHCPDSTRALSATNETALHRLLEHCSPSSSSSSIEVVRWLLDRDPLVLQRPSDRDGCLPLHLLLDCRAPDVSLATRMLALYPTAAKMATRDGLLPLHIVLSANQYPSVDLVRQLLQLHPESLSCWVTDIVPAATGAGNPQGNSSGWDSFSHNGGGNVRNSIDLELWSGEWLERRWCPLLRAKERELVDLVQLFTQTLMEQFGVSEEEVLGVFADPAMQVQELDADLSHLSTSSNNKPMQQKRSNQQQQPRRSAATSLHSNNSFYSNNNNNNNNYDSADSEGEQIAQRVNRSGLSNTYPVPDTGKPVPQHLLAIKKRPVNNASSNAEGLFSATSPVGASSVGSLPSQDSSGYHLPNGNGSGFNPTASLKVLQGGGSFRPSQGRAPLPSSPLPATLLQVAESSALRFIKANNNNNNNPNPILPKGVVPSAASVVSLSRPMSRPTSRPGSGYRPDRDGSSKAAINAAASLLISDNTASNNNTNSNSSAVGNKGDVNKTKLKPNPTGSGSTSLSMLKSNAAMTNKVYPLDSVV
eukprot:CAMPEP_0170057284 /NCGR_PEP_ID=MMETSP0019_2-20121128/349_1 /TAXON_ID=98059 /ORGANISM="Dinobryon sp., Strain UTEXLB2267" /LENGTH=701 /DNA_ID=CAMNT_0010261955 /DNA_START=484 /DNA_END=2589 /DNA_ORIENTATION=-